MGAFPHLASIFSRSEGSTASDARSRVTSKSSIRLIAVASPLLNGAIMLGRLAVLCSTCMPSDTRMSALCQPL